MSSHFLYVCMCMYLLVGGRNVRACVCVCVRVNGVMGGGALTEHCVCVCVCVSWAAAGANAGSTATVALLRDGIELVVASVGDSRAMLSRKGKALKLTVDHHPDRKDEKERYGTRTLTTLIQ